MNCHRVGNLLSAYIDGELTGVEMIEIRRHLDGCPGCQNELDDLRAVKRLVGRLHIAQPVADLPGRIYAGLDNVQPYSWLRYWSAIWQSGFQRLSPAVAAVTCVFLGMLIFTARTIDEGFEARHPQTYAPVVAASPFVTSPAGASFSAQPPAPAGSPVAVFRLQPVDRTAYQPVVFSSEPAADGSDHLWARLGDYGQR